MVELLTLVGGITFAKLIMIHNIIISVFLLLMGGVSFVSATPSVMVILARYKESLHHLRWLQHVPHVIYNRHLESASDTDVLNLVHQPINVGREGWIYADHIVRNYHNLSDINIFSQAVHNVVISDEGFHEEVELLVRGGKSLKQRNGFAYFGNMCLKVRSHMGDIDMVKNKFNISDSATPRTAAGMREIISKIIDKKDLPADPERLRFTPTAVFAVTRAAIHSNPIDYYVRLRDFVLGDGDKDNTHGEGMYS